MLKAFTGEIIQRLFWVSKLGKQSALPKAVQIVHVNKEAHLPFAGFNQLQLISQKLYSQALSHSNLSSFDKSTNENSLDWRNS